MRKVVLSILAVSGLALAPAANAGTSAGQSEVGFNFNMTDSGGTTALAVATSYNYFFTDSLSVGGTLIVFGNDSGGADYGQALDIGADWHFSPSADWVPYVGVGLGYFNFGGVGSSSESSYNVRGGVKGFISERTAIDLQIRVDDGSSFPDSVTQFNAGFRFYFGG